MSGDVYFNRNTQDDNPEPEYTARTVSSYLERVDIKPEDDGEKDDRPGDFGGTIKKKKHIALKIICVILGLIVVLSAALCITVSAVLKDYEPEALAKNEYVADNSLLTSSSVYNILLMGIDSKDVENTSRSDAMILMSIDSHNMQVKLTSFMRDSYVSIPGYGWAKLNAACTWGGPQLVVDTIEYNFGIDIDAYCKIGYEMLITLVDGIGGITVPEISDVESRALSILKVNIEPGLNIHLDGNEALQYCRIRKGQSDFNRTERQRETITIIIKKCLRTNPVKLVKVMKSIVGEVKCSLSKAGIMRLAMKTLPCLLGDIRSGRVPADGTWYNDTRNSQAVLIVDTEKNREYLKEFIYG